MLHLDKFKMKKVFWYFLVVGSADSFVPLPTTPPVQNMEDFKRSFSRMSSTADSTPLIEDNSIDEYSRCLSPSQERDQMKEELGIKVDPRWKKIVKKPFQTVGRIVNRSLEGKKKCGALILIRCGESEDSRGENPKFTGWDDPKLTMKGIQEMEHTGRLLLESGYEPDVIYTSRLKRAIKSAWVIVQEISLPFIPMHKSWRLNERHYGSLQGLRKKEMAKTFGADVVQAWRRSLLACPPPVAYDDPHYPGNNRKFSDLRKEQIPRSESLLDCMKRAEPLWNVIKKDLATGENVMVVAHSTTLRGLAKIIDDVGDLDIADVSFPKGIPCVYKFDTNMNPLEPVDDSLRQIHTSGTFLEKTDLLKKAMESVKEWEDNVPGTKGSSLPNVAKRMTTMENALLQLKEEQQVWSRLEDGSENNDNDDDIIVPHSANNDSSNHEERFEEMSNISTNPSEKIEANMKAVNSRDDPVVVFIRHGRTPHNKLALFTGWEDPPLAEEGEEDARWAGRLLKEHGFEFDVVYTSWLFRAIQTAYFALEELDQLYLPLVKSWRLNERHYGDLTGKSKKMIANIHGEEQLKRWRKGYKVRPPPVSSYSFNYPGNDKRRAKYVKDLPISITETFCRSFEDRKLTIHRKFPKCESLFDCMNRSIPFYTQKIVPEAVAQGKRVLITSHENAIRGILMHLCDIPEDCMNDLHLPNGVPLVYNVKRRCISLLDEGSNEDPVEKYDFGSAAKYLFRACEIEDDSS